MTLSGVVTLTNQLVSVSDCSLVVFNVFFQMFREENSMLNPE